MSDDFDYSIRTNKCVERKLIFQILSCLAPVFKFENYRYIGFGSMWFVDFIMAHKIIFVSDMISIERNEIRAGRANFNRPFSCVEVKHGESEFVLPTLDLKEKPLIAWLDYSDSIDGPVFKDLSVLCQRAPTGSVFIATINAQKGSISNKDDSGTEFENDAERLRYYAGDLVPAVLPIDAMQVTKYPALLASFLIAHMRHAVEYAGRDNVDVVPLFNLRYKDNAIMTSVGAMIVEGGAEAKMAEVLGAKGFASYLDVDKQQIIEVPSLTHKEKKTLDQLLPSDAAPTPEAVSKLGFPLRQPDIESYHRFYRYYPTFAELTV